MISRRLFIQTLVATATLAACQKNEPTGGTDYTDNTSPPANNTIGPYMAPAVLAGRLADVKSGKVQLLHVGPEAVFHRGRIPGARWIGEAGEADGYAALIDAMKKAPADSEIVLYCGCCAVRDCPNVRPASRALREAGHPKTFVLDLPTNFKTDWENKGYETLRG